MMLPRCLSSLRVVACASFLAFTSASAAPADEPRLRIARDKNWLVITGERLPGAGIRVNYLEAYCRAGSSNADWSRDTVIRHTSELIRAEPDGSRIELRDTLADGVIVDHVISTAGDEVRFEVTAMNPTAARSEAHWAQPCVRLSAFTGHDDSNASNATDYLPQCFIFVAGKLTQLPTDPWETQARYVPGQVWCPRHVSRSDVNPRPLSPVVPSNGLIGCFSADRKFIFATAWEPYQELFQGVARCLHSDFRIGGLAPGERKQIRGRIYVVGNTPAELVTRYERDFPEHLRLQQP